MTEAVPRYHDVGRMIGDLAPEVPVYCIYTKQQQRVAREFLAGFPGRVMYAVKANPSPHIVRHLMKAGVEAFDTASVPEMEVVHALDPRATCFFMAPVRMPGAARIAYDSHRVRHFVVDHRAELARLARDLPGRDVTIFVRMAAHNRDATYSLSEKFGTDSDGAVALLHEVCELGFEPALAFNVGSLVLKPRAYVDALAACADVLERADVPVRMLDVGGGFPSSYPGMKTPPVDEFFRAIREMRETLALDPSVELLAEPGRALVAEGMSLVTLVLHRDDDRLFVNDGIWGSLMEPWISKGQMSFPTRAFGKGGAAIQGPTKAFRLLGPTCDALDQLPVPFELPEAVAVGDWVEFGTIGAYSVSGRTHFNGFYPDRFVELTGEDATPPTM